MKNREVIKDKNKEEKRQMINKANIKFFFNKLRCTRNNTYVGTGKKNTSKLFLLTFQVIACMRL